MIFDFEIESWVVLGKMVGEKMSLVMVLSFLLMFLVFILMVVILICVGIVLSYFWGKLID